MLEAETAPRSVSLRVALYGFCIGLLLAGVYLVQHVTIRSPYFEFADFSVWHTSAIYACAGILAGTFGGMFAVMWPRQGRQPFAAGMTGFLIVLPVTVFFFALIKPGRVELSDLATAAAFSALAGLWPAWAEERRRIAIGNAYIPEADRDRYEPPPRMGEEKSEFDLS